MKNVKRRVIEFLSLFAFAGAALAAAEVGKPAPDFTGTDINGKTHKLSDYKGKIVVLESYNQDCPFCHNHFKTGAMQELQADLARQGVVWLIINSVNAKNPSYRTPAAAQREWADLKIKATAWIDDHSGQIGKAYGMRTTPDMFVINKQGILVYDGAIDNRPEPDGDPRTARNYVKEAVQSSRPAKKSRSQRPSLTVAESNTAVRVPEGHPIIAQRFSVGTRNVIGISPVGTTEHSFRFTKTVPSGLGKLRA
jgi:peroxiredoxin